MDYEEKESVRGMMKRRGELKQALEVMLDGGLSSKQDIMLQIMIIECQLQKIGVAV